MTPVSALASLGLTAAREACRERRAPSSGVPTCTWAHRQELERRQASVKPLILPHSSKLRTAAVPTRSRSEDSPSGRESSSRQAVLRTRRQNNSLGLR